ncbi:Acyl-CoA dehydrogenase domain-containing protein [Pyrenophora teres f. maculata]|nr:Acyl-CoA dehydrogenase domain-containing protein [Pyrenophora teres f. maculata]
MFSLPAKRTIRSTPPKPCLARHFSHTPHLPIMSTSNFTPTQLEIRTAIQSLCTSFPNSYWRAHDASATDPTTFHSALAAGGWLGIALPTRYGGSGLGISEATMMMQTISESGAGMAGAQAVHGNVYATQPLIRHGSTEMCENLVPRIVKGEVRVCFGVTEPGSGLDTLGLRTRAVREGDEYVVSGDKVWITAAQVAGVMILLARTGDGDHDVGGEDWKSKNGGRRSRSHGLSLFSIPLDCTNPALEIRRIRKMGGRAVDANQVFFDKYRVPASSLIGAENHGFKIILQGMNAERCLLAGEALGLGYCALSRAAEYARTREVFNRPIGMNQGIAHPLADAYMALEAAKLATYHAARLYDESQQEGSTVMQDVVGVAANSAKYLAAEAAFRACERAVLTHGGMGYAEEYDVERWFRESLVPRIAPVSREMILNYIGEKVLGLPRSY